MKTRPSAKKSSNPNSSIIQKLDQILEMELSGVTRYLHYSLMITGPNRIPIVKFFRDQASEALQHATIIGEKITALGGHPSVRVSPVPETHKHSTMEILEESLGFEKVGMAMYLKVLPLCKNNVALEELIREFIKIEQEHIEEVEKMLKISGDRRL
ncbi:MAG: bacterioferritin [Deltaproteobacteria bacterium]|nr:bacterioferritin [Deltaproteobacteria bacterium]